VSGCGLRGLGKTRKRYQTESDYQTGARQLHGQYSPENFPEEYYGGGPAFVKWRLKKNRYKDALS
jgi:hypothetical protein